MLQIYNSLTRKKETFIPLKPNEVKIYVCGITVYDYCHLGHARMFVTFDFITRFLRSQGYQVTYVRNITDIDDKIIARANLQGVEWQNLTQQFIQAMHEDEKVLYVLPPDIEPKATAHIPQMISMIEKLIVNGYAYVSENKDVCFRVKNFKKYGQLSGKDIEGLQVGSRVDISEAKENPLDFVLWKHAKLGEPSWPSPWGEGRPGWHIECSAMSTTYLGETFDMHGGGFDLQFPHHENEIAQSECAFGCEFVRYWLHNGFVQVDEEKMSKSLNNFLTIRDILATHHPEVIRFFMASSHYRSPISYSEQHLQQAKSGLNRLYQALRELEIPQDLSQSQESHFEKAFNASMNDDFNTPEALAVLFELAHEINLVKSKDKKLAQKLGALLVYLGQILGFLFSDPEQFLQGEQNDQSIKEIENLIKQREMARQNKEWGRADEIRDLLKDRGIVLEDKAEKTLWRRV